MKSNVISPPSLLLTGRSSLAALSPKSRQSEETDHEAVKRRVRDAGLDVMRISELPSKLGFQYTVIGGALLVVYNTGNSDVQGKPSDKDRRRLKRAFRVR